MDAAFSSDNWLGIPCLDIELQADCVPLPVWAWGSIARTTENKGTWHFFVADPRFSAAIKDPSLVVATGCAAAVEPNISVFDDTPMALALASVYRRRWVAKYWQTCGMRVFIDLNLPARVLGRPEFMFGVPTYWRAFATRGYEKRLDALEYEWHFAKTICADPVFLIVGGGRKVAEWCNGRSVIHSGYTSTKEAYRHVQGK